MPEGRDVLRSQARVLGPGGDRLIDAAVLLERVCELACARRALNGRSLNLLSGRLRPSVPDPPLVAERIAHELAEVEPTGARRPRKMKPPPKTKMRKTNAHFA
mgnify:CR=1 FL=1